MVKYIGDCNVCRLKVYLDENNVEVRKQGKGRPPETLHNHKKAYTIERPESYVSDTGELRGWEIYAMRMGAF